MPDTKLLEKLRSISFVGLVTDGTEDFRRDRNKAKKGRS